MKLRKCLSKVSIAEFSIIYKNLISRDGELFTKKLLDGIKLKKYFKKLKNTPGKLQE